LARRSVWPAGALAGALVAFGLAAIPPAAADTTPPAGTPPTVSDDALPTWQLNGVVWNQVTVGNIVYAVGNFTDARPPGAAAGVNQVPANDIFAYDITTGLPVGYFSHQLNGQALAVAASPDGSRVYVGGDFTTVDGVARSHIAAFDTVTGALDTSFAPTVSNEVGAIAATNSTVYVGGDFFTANGKARNELAAFTASNGALLPWAPVAAPKGQKVQAMVISPDGSRVIVGGMFSTLNGVSACGMGSLDAVTGATDPWAINKTACDATHGGIDTLATDGTSIYGAGWAFGAGASFEGEFSADPDTGNINWLNDCHGDTYSVFPIGQVLYTVSHAHSCQWIGSFPNTKPSWTPRHALAFTTYASGGVNTGPDDYGWNYAGIPDSSLLYWFPTLAIGTFTGQNQAAWSVTGNSNYIALGGEFPSVNGVAQQDLVRFAISSIAPNKMGPVYSSSLVPTAKSVTAGTIQVAWPATWDPDNQTLTYQLFRDSGTTPIYTTTEADTSFTTTYPGAPTGPAMSFTDTGLTPGSTHDYRLKVSDPFGNNLDNMYTPTVTVAGTPPSG
jgi:trimeric autotransporter adhesin